MDPWQPRLRAWPLPGGAHPAGAAPTGPPSPFLALEHGLCQGTRGRGPAEASGQKPVGVRGVGAGGSRVPAQTGCRGDFLPCAVQARLDRNSSEGERSWRRSAGEGLRHPLPPGVWDRTRLLSQAELPPQRGSGKTQVGGCFLSV